MKSRTEMHRLSSVLLLLLFLMFLLAMIVEEGVVCMMGKESSKQYEGPRLYRRAFPPGLDPYSLNNQEQWHSPPHYICHETCLWRSPILKGGHYPGPRTSQLRDHEFSLSEVLESRISINLQLFFQNSSRKSIMSWDRFLQRRLRGVFSNSLDTSSPLYKPLECFEELQLLFEGSECLDPRMPFKIVKWRRGSSINHNTRKDSCRKEGRNALELLSWASRVSLRRFGIGVVLSRR